MGTLEPLWCEIEENAAGLYELTLRQPITQDNRAFLLLNDRIIKADAPVRETPQVVISGASGGETVTREIWRVRTNGSRLHLRSKPNGHIIGAYPPGTRVVKYGESSVSGWWGVIVCDGGAKGYMYSDYLQYEGVEEEQIGGDAPGRVIQPRQSREQLFRIYSVTTDSAGRYVEARARHISYDMAGAVVKGQCVLEGIPAARACEMLIAAADHDSGFEIICAAEGSISGDFTGMSLLECLLDPEIGVAKQTGAKVLRDHFSVFLLPDEERDRGVEIRYGKNLTGARLEKDSSGIVTRIIPVGKDEKGELLIGAQVDSPHIDEYPAVRTAWIEYDVKAGKDLSREQALLQLEELARADLDAGCDLIGAQLDASFLRLELADEYREIANEYALHLYDSVPVRDIGAGIDVKVRMTGYVFDVLRRRYIETRLGDIGEVNGLVYGFELASGAVTNAKIAKNAVDSLNLRNLSVTSAKIGTAAITNAKIALLAVDTANIANLAVTAAKIADAAITSAKIENAAIGSAQIGKAAIEQAHIADAAVTRAKIADAAVGTAQIADAAIGMAKIKNAAVDTAKIALGAITAALIENGAVGTAQIADGSITDAKIVELTANKINAGTLSVERLIVVGGEKSIVYTINSANGTPQLSQTTIDGGALTERSITADRIVAGAITAREIAAASILANNINVQDLFASDATILQLDNYLLRTSTIEALAGKLDLWAQNKIDIAVGGVAIGGRNLLRGTQYWDAAHWAGVSGKTIADETITIDGSGLTSGYTETYQNIYLEPGRTYTFSVELTEILSTAAGIVLHAFAYDLTAAKVYNAIYALRPALGRHCVTFTVPEGSSRFRFCVRAYAGVSFSVRHMQVEEGNKLSAWRPSPDDYAKGVVNGSGLRLTPDELTLYAAKSLEINVQGDNGDAHFGANGLAVDRVNSPSVYAQYCGPVVLTVGVTALGSPNGESIFATLGDAFAKLSNKHLYSAVTINFASSTQETRCTLHNVTGSPIVVNGNNCTLTGHTAIENVGAEVTINNLTLQYSGAGHVVSTRHCKDIGFVECTINAAYPGVAGQIGVYGLSSDIGFVRCAFTNCYHAIWLSDNSRAYIEACTGSNDLYALILRTHSQAGMITSRPPGMIDRDTSCPAPNDPNAAESGAVDMPAIAQTAVFTATNTRTHDGGGWYSGTNVLSQGVYAGTTFRGFMWFDLAALRGKTINSASIRLYRRAGVGRGSAVKVLVGAHKASGPSGSMNLINGFNDHVVGYVDQKDTLSASIAAAAVQHIADGTATGLYLHSDSTGYAQFDGYDGSVPPQLTVTYT